MKRRVARRVRLPIYGEARADRQRRDLWDRPTFGQWLEDVVSTSDKDDWQFFEAFTLLDGHQCIRRMSVNDCLRLFMEFGEDVHPIEWSELREAVSLFEDGLPTHRCVLAEYIDDATENPGVYFVQQGPEGPIKIGVAQNVRLRMRGLQTSSPYPLRLLGVIRGGPAEERAAHATLQSHKLLREWFKPHPDVLAYLMARRAS